VQAAVEFQVAVLGDFPAAAGELVELQAVRPGLDRFPGECLASALFRAALAAEPGALDWVPLDALRSALDAPLPAVQQA